MRTHHKFFCAVFDSKTSSRSFFIHSTSRPRRNEMSYTPSDRSSKVQSICMLSDQPVENRRFSTNFSRPSPFLYWPIEVAHWRTSYNPNPKLGLGGKSWSQGGKWAHLVVYGDGRGEWGCRQWCNRVYVRCGELAVKEVCK